jgi:hypothetical protein
MKAFKIIPFLLFISFGGFATHLRGGHISYQLVDPNTRTVEITLQLFIDTSPGSVDQPDAEINFGDGSPCADVRVLTREVVGGEMAVLIFKLLHSYPADGSYLISFSEENRDERVINILDPGTRNSTFAISSLIKIDAFNKNSNSFKFFNNRSQDAEVGKEFSMTILGYDADGDSLSFSLVRPQTANAQIDCSLNVPFEINDFFVPDSAYINPFSGNIKWTPSSAGFYVFDVKITEFKNGAIVGYTTKEFIIECKEGNIGLQLEKTDNLGLKPFEVIDINAGTTVNLKARFKTDPANEIDLLAFSELLEKNIGVYSTYDSAGYKVANYSLFVDPSIKRKQPYIFTFRGVSKTNPELKKDLTYVLNTQEGLQFNYIHKQSSEDPILSTKDNLKVEPITFYPNPARESFFINTSAYPSAEILFFDSKGLAAGTLKLSTSSIVEVKRNNLLPGVYFFIIQSNGIRKAWGKVVFE